MKLPEQVSKSTRARNPGLYNWKSVGSPPDGTELRKVIRQSTKPKLNKTEAAFGEWLRHHHPDSVVLEQSLKFNLANGCWLTPDCVVFHTFAGTIDAYDVKGFMRDDAAVKIKVAARLYPFIKWYLAWRKKGEWNFQQVIP